MEFMRKLLVCEKDIRQPQVIIIYDSHVKESACEYHNLVDSKQWDTTSVKEKSQYQHYILKPCTL